MNRLHIIFFGVFFLAQSVFFLPTAALTLALDKETREFLHPFVSVGLGLSIMDGTAARVGVLIAPDDRRARTNLGVNTQSALGFTFDGGVAVWDIVRAGAFLNHSTAFNQRFTTGDVDDIEGDFVFLGEGSGETIKLSKIYLTSVGAFGGVQFELGANTPTRHYLYFDYGFGFINNTTRVSGQPSHHSGSLVHMARFGLDLPMPKIMGISGLGVGLEFQWLEPEDKDIPNNFSLLVKTSYRF